jgi:predicted P-loop ATPase
MPEQAARYEGDAWEENIAGYLATKTRVTIGDVARDALFIETPRIGTADQRRIAAALEQLGWRRERTDGKTDWQGKRWWVQGQTQRTTAHLLSERPIGQALNGKCAVVSGCDN